MVVSLIIVPLKVILFKIFSLSLVLYSFDVYLHSYLWLLCLRYHGISNLTNKMFHKFWEILSRCFVLFLNIASHSLPLLLRNSGYIDTYKTFPLWLPCVLKILILSKLYTLHGAQTYNSEIQSHTLYALSQPGTALCVLICVSCFSSLSFYAVWTILYLQ